MFNKNKQIRSIPSSQTRRNSSSSLGSESLSRRHKPDYLLLVLSLILCAVGLVVVYAISPALAATRDVDGSYFVIKQAISVGLGILAFATFSFISPKKLADYRNVLIAFAVVGAIAVQFFGEEVNGANRWIQIGGLSFQVAELIKFALIVWIASFLVERMLNNEMGNFKKTLRPLLIALSIVGVVVAFFESDLGSTAVMFAIMGVMAFVAGLPMKKVVMVILIVAVASTVAISTSEYRRDRISTFLNPTADCQNDGYQACQALIAVGSGGLSGLGLGNSVQAYGYLPEAANDSIFAVYAEKFGFIGVSFLLFIYFALFSRLKRIIERTADDFSRLFVVGYLTWISTQTIINVGAMMGLLPLKGITLPFVSYGGTSIFFIMAGLGVVFYISRYTSYEPLRNSKQLTGDRIEQENSPMRGRVGRPYYTSAGRRA